MSGDAAGYPNSSKKQDALEWIGDRDNYMCLKTLHARPRLLTSGLVERIVIGVR